MSLEAYQANLEREAKEAAARSGGGGGGYIPRVELQNGQTVVGRFLTGKLNSAVIWVHMAREGKKLLWSGKCMDNWAGAPPCAGCAQGVRAQRTVVPFFFNYSLVGQMQAGKDGKAYAADVLNRLPRTPNQTNAFYKADDDYGLTGCDVYLTRIGEDTASTYQIAPVMQQQQAIINGQQQIVTIKADYPFQYQGEDKKILTLMKAVAEMDFATIFDLALACERYCPGQRDFQGNLIGENAPNFPKTHIAHLIAYGMIANPLGTPVAPPDPKPAPKDQVQAPGGRIMVPGQQGMVYPNQGYQNMVAQPPMGGQQLPQYGMPAAAGPAQAPAPTQMAQNTAPGYSGYPQAAAAGAGNMQTTPSPYPATNHTTAAGATNHSGWAGAPAMGGSPDVPTHTQPAPTATAGMTAASSGAHPGPAYPQGPGMNAMQGQQPGAMPYPQPQQQQPQYVAAPESAPTAAPQYNQAQMMNQGAVAQQPAPYQQNAAQNAQPGQGYASAAQGSFTPPYQPPTGAPIQPVQQAVGAQPMPQPTAPPQQQLVSGQGWFDGAGQRAGYEG